MRSGEEGYSRALGILPQSVLPVRPDARGEQSTVHPQRAGLREGSLHEAADPGPQQALLLRADQVSPVLLRRFQCVCHASEVLCLFIQKTAHKGVP